MKTLALVSTILFPIAVISACGKSNNDRSTTHGGGGIAEYKCEARYETVDVNLQFLGGIPRLSRGDEISVKVGNRQLAFNVVSNINSNDVYKIEAHSTAVTMLFPQNMELDFDFAKGEAYLIAPLGALPKRMSCERG